MSKTPRIDPRLFERFKGARGLSRAAAYRNISKLATQLAVTNDIAALAVAQDAGIPINRYGTPEQLAALRQARQTHPAPSPAAAAVPAARRAAAKGTAKPPSKIVFVVHGRNDKIRRAMFDFLRAVDLTPLDWATAMKGTRKAAPYVGEVLDKAFNRATAVVVLITPDDEAQLRREFRRHDDEAYEKKLMGQARANVLFEAGMAFGTHANETILVQVGKCRPFSDTFGRHIVKLDNSEVRRQELFDKLRIAKCPATKIGRAWLDTGDFSVE
jgi:predicted nucleotide-binding protein